VNRVRFTGAFTAMKSIGIATGALLLASAMVTDVTDAAQVQALVDAAVAQHGRINVILNNAGVMPHSPLERRKIDDWSRTIDINIKGVLYGIAAALPHMQRQKSGHIINVSALAGHRVAREARSTPRRRPRCA
jgi:NADP-dependent 3-hydroxy acid dehydrogenase YdfG